MKNYLTTHTPELGKNGGLFKASFNVQGLEEKCDPETNEEHPE